MRRLLTGLVCVVTFAGSACDSVERKAPAAAGESAAGSAAVAVSASATETAAAPETAPETATPTGSATATETETEPAPDSSEPRIFGHVRRPNGPVTPLATIAANPTRYQGSQVRTEGSVLRVCQKRGCWMEMRGKGGTRVFVQIAGHRFSVPIDAAGSDALVEGKVHRRKRSHAERQHLKADGASDDIPALSIMANAVVIR